MPTYAILNQMLVLNQQPATPPRAGAPPILFPDRDLIIEPPDRLVGLMGADRNLQSIFGGGGEILLAEDRHIDVEPDEMSSISSGKKKKVKGATRKRTTN